MAGPLAASLTTSAGLLFDTQSVAASVNSLAVPCANLDYVYIQIASNTGTHVGTLAVQTSADGVTWTDRQFVNTSTGASATSIALASGVANADTVVIDPMGALYLRLAYTASSGTGTLTAIASVKRSPGRA